MRAMKSLLPSPARIAALILPFSTWLKIFSTTSGSRRKCSRTRKRIRSMTVVRATIDVINSGHITGPPFKNNRIMVSSSVMAVLWIVSRKIGRVAQKVSHHPQCLTYQRQGEGRSNLKKSLALSYGAFPRKKSLSSVFHFRNKSLSHPTNSSWRLGDMKSTTSLCGSAEMGVARLLPLVLAANLAVATAAFADDQTNSPAKPEVTTPPIQVQSTDPATNPAPEPPKAETDQVTPPVQAPQI